MQILVGAAAEGEIANLDAPLSFWGGVEAETGRIVERRHPQFGQVLTGQIVVMPHGRGSSSSATVLAEMIRLKTAPTGVILGEADEILLAGAFVANALYESHFVLAVGSVSPHLRGSFRLDRNGLHRLDV